MSPQKLWMPTWKQLQAVRAVFFPLSCSPGSLVQPNCMSPENARCIPTESTLFISISSLECPFKSDGRGNDGVKTSENLSSVKTMRTAAKIGRTDFLRTQKINQRASVYWRKKIKVRISVRTWALWCCNLLDLILHSLVPQEPWKPAASNLRKASSNLAPFPHLAGSQEDPTCKTCLCLTRQGAQSSNAVFSSASLALNGSGTLSSQGCHHCMECLGSGIQMSPSLPDLSFLQVLVQMSPSPWGFLWPCCCNATWPIRHFPVPFPASFPFRTFITFQRATYLIYLLHLSYVFLVEC